MPAVSADPSAHTAVKVQDNEECGLPRADKGKLVLLLLLLWMHAVPGLDSRQHTCRGENCACMLA